MKPADDQAIDHAGIAALIPHSGRMCLLSAVQSWDADSICCTATSHTDSDNPLRSDSGLLASAAIEYAAQAAAVHGGLLASAAGATARPGYLASARNVQFHRLRLDDLAGELVIEAARQAGDDRQLLYGFTISHQGRPVIDGRLAVVLNTPLST